MRTLLAALPILAACSSPPAGPGPGPTTVAVTAHARPGFTGSTEAFVYDGATMVSRTPFTDHVDVVVAEGQSVTVVTRGKSIVIDTFYELVPGDAVDVAVADEGPSHTVAVELPPGDAADSVQLEVDGGTGQGVPGGNASMVVSDGRASVPALAIVRSPTGAIDGFYGARGIDVSGAAATVDQPLALSTTTLASTIPTGSTLTPEVHAWSGDDFFLIGQRSAPMASFPVGFADSTEIGVTVATSTSSKFIAQTFDGDPPPSYDFGDLVTSTPVFTADSFDNERTTWRVEGDSFVEWTLTSSAGIWNLSAPPQVFGEPLPELPADLPPLTAWHPYGIFAVDCPGVAYEDMIADAGWWHHGEHRWSTGEAGFAAPTAAH